MNDRTIRVTTESCPVLSGPTVVVEGYHQLSALECDFKEQAYRLHLVPATLWYRGLTLYRRCLVGSWDQSDKLHPEFGARVANLQSQLLGLGISTSKSALDALLAGYYSTSFAAVRHMLETTVQYLYLVTEPKEYVRWYQQEDSSKVRTKSPGCKHMIKTIQGHKELEEQGFPMSYMNDIYASWDLMSKGSHPTGEGIVQTVDEDNEGRFVYGATYNRDFCLTGFDHGLFALHNLLLCLGSHRPVLADWRAEHNTLSAEISVWRNAEAKEIEEASKKIQ